MTRGRRPLAAFCLLLLAYCLLPAVLPLSSSLRAQEIVDRMVATVNAGVQVGLITYSDLLWQMALQPGTPLANPNQESLSRALQIVINQRLILQEAEKLPTIAATDEEVRTALADLINRFPSRAEFQQRVERVGLSSEQLRDIIRQRVQIEKYLNFRFRSFTVVTPKEVEDYYTQVYVPRLRQRAPERIVPKLEDVRPEIEKTLTESKIESDTDAFLDSAREQAEIICLDTSINCQATRLR